MKVKQEFWIIGSRDSGIDIATSLIVMTLIATLKSVQTMLLS